MAPSPPERPPGADLLPVERTAEALARDLVVDEDADLVRWTDKCGVRRVTGFHDYAALYAVPGLYEAAYFVALRGRAPDLLADLLADAVPDPSVARVLDVGCGTGAVGTALRRRGFGPVAGIDLEPAVLTAVPRDRPGTYGTLRALDLTALPPDDRAWLAAVAPDVVTVVAAVGFGHLPLAAFRVLADLLPPGGLLALTVARDLADTPALADHAALLLGPAFRHRAARDGVHRTTASGRDLLVTALVLERTSHTSG
ncbi:MAG: class I SAM-dependent methyltransferase [Actinomycetota bacterium]|nr:class I SAM-dependent methyltransferase [Actinomycetota bacterium]